MLPDGDVGLTASPILLDPMLPMSQPHNTTQRIFRLLCVTAVFALSSQVFAADALSRITFTDAAKQTRTIDGRILVEAQDGGILLEGRDGTLWNITPEQRKSRTNTGKVFTPFSAKELTARLKTEFGKRFAVYSTPHYLICSDAGKYYAQWCGILFERLHKAFYKHWDSADLKLTKPTFPLIAVVFADRKSYGRYAQQDAGISVGDSVGIFSIRSNRIVLVDLTAKPNARPARSVLEVSRKVRRSPFNVSTVVHEATHQIAFNSGLHKRYADNPLWLTEGMAMYFETPDMRSTKGWGTVGKVNPIRLRQYKDYARKRRKADSVKSLVAGDTRLTAVRSSVDAYAEAWALTYFLIKTRRKDYEAYLKRIAIKPLLIFATPATRLKEFEQAFGNTADLEKTMQRYLARIRR